MNLAERDRRALLILAGALAVVAVLRFWVLADPKPASAVVTDDIPRAEQRLKLMRQAVASLPVNEAMLKQADADLSDRERGIIRTETAAQAQAALVEIARRVGKTEELDVRSAELGAPKTLGPYGLVYAAIAFDCHIEQLVSFLADLTREPELAVPSEMRISSGNAKEKLMTVRMVLAGVVDKKLVPEEGIGRILKPKLMALNAALAAGVLLVAWQVRERVESARAVRNANLNVPVRKVTPPPFSPAQKPEVLQPAKYADVADKNVFSKDRNATVIVEPPKVEAPKVMPPLPVVYGVMGLPSGMKAIVSDKGSSRSVKTGDVVGEFKILAVDTRSMTFEWDGRKIERPLEDLIDRSGQTATAGAAATNGPAVPPPAATPPPPSGPPTKQNLGAEIGAPGESTRACQPGDTAPAGSIVEDGGVRYQKTVMQTPFGSMCRWTATR